MTGWYQRDVCCCKHITLMPSSEEERSNRRERYVRKRALCWQELLSRKHDQRQTMCFTQRIEAVKAILGFGKNASGTNGTKDRLMSPSATRQAVP
jgi:hypothetical protein